MGLYKRAWRGSAKDSGANHVLSLEYSMKSVSKYSSPMPSGVKLHVCEPLSTVRGGVIDTVSIRYSKECGIESVMLQNSLADAVVVPHFFDNPVL